MKILEEKVYGDINKIGFKYAKTLTEENDLLKGGGIFVSKKQIINICLADSLWVNDNDKPFYLAVHEGVFYVGKLAIGF